MTNYRAPEQALLHCLRTTCEIDSLLAQDRRSDVTGEDLSSILSHAARFAADRLASLNLAADRQGASLVEGRVRTPSGIADAYTSFRQDGWASVPFDPELGGGGMPWALNFALCEIWCAANAAFSQLPILTQCAIAPLQIAAPEWIRKTWLPKLASGEWTVALGMTEPQAGSDLGLVRTRAVPCDDGYAVFGQKIFTTYGDHDCAENIVQLVLARLPDAPIGASGLSLFAVPNVLVSRAGDLIGRNRVHVASLEHKIGFHASPTCVTVFGEGDSGAIGYLIGAAHQGLATLFWMLNGTRLATAVQAVGLADRAFQQARNYAEDRLQGRGIEGGPNTVAIIEHPDVQRMLLLMRALIAGSRTLTLYTAAQMDIAARHPSQNEREAAATRLELLTPIAKAWCSERSVEATSLAIQVHGGAGYVEETGIGQYWRDARVGPIYEGANGIQALDFSRRKLSRDKGAALREFAQSLMSYRQDAPAELQPIYADLAAAVEELLRATDHSIGLWQEDAKTAAAVASDLSEFAGTVIAGCLLAREAVLGTTDPATPAAIEATLVAQLYAASVLPRWHTLSALIRKGEAVARARPLL